ncbi:putative cyclase [Nitrospira sp. KM1]|uniref:cyclase family protein n=1 Tax=Nitrospira sp. KM1 TaxID=1936990 RepID=UPI0013A71679|nr:cyclase family protein [Nitrospira sp. KM1]BCA55906.1 putative cyclase [Nitrospira sp. KM1]
MSGQPYRMRIIVAVCLLVMCSCSSDPVPTGTFVHEKFVDLTHPFEPETIVWPTEQNFRLITQFQGDTPAGYYYSSNRIEMPEHGGTHIDAPIHFAKGGRTLDRIPLDKLIGAGVRIDVSSSCSRERDYRVMVRDLQQWESLNGTIPSHAIVLLDTGFARLWPNRRDYLGTELRGPAGVRELHFPGLHPEAAAWLIRERHVKAVGIDTASIDYGQSIGFESHVTLLSNDIAVFENVADLSLLPARGFNVVALPMKIAEGSGGPLRIIAVMSEAK